MTRRRTTTRWRWVAPLVVYAVILGLSSVSSDRLEPLGFAAWMSYVGHAVEYGALGAALRWAAVGWRRPVAAVIAIGAVCGALDELWQSTVPGRDPSLLDLGVDVAAVAVAAVVAVRWMGRGG